MTAKTIEQLKDEFIAAETTLRSLSWLRAKPIWRGRQQSLRCGGCQPPSAYTTGKRVSLRP